VVDGAVPTGQRRPQCCPTKIRTFYTKQKLGHCSPQAPEKMPSFLFESLVVESPGLSRTGLGVKFRQLAPARINLIFCQAKLHEHQLELAPRNQQRRRIV